MTKMREMACACCGTAMQVTNVGHATKRYCGPGCRPACVVDGCEKTATGSFGMCWGHYQRLRKYGRADEPRRPNNLPSPPKQCSVDGCEKVLQGKSICAAHAAARRRSSNPVKCAVTECEQPVHAQNWCPKHYKRFLVHGDPEGTAYSDSCLQGHEFTPENTRFQPGNGRRCRACSRARQALRRALQKGADAENISWMELMKRDNWMCGICGDRISPQTRWPDPLFGSIDHVMPLSQGGAHRWDNVQAAHLVCNMRKNARTDFSGVKPRILGSMQP